MVTDKLIELESKCKFSINLEINTHRDFYLSVDEYFKKDPIQEDYIEDIDHLVFEEMKKRDTIIELQFYPNSTNGFYIIHHYDLDKALDKALSIF